ncbi:alpha/beta fold hydrolase [Haloarcula nitratireducens]|uniref:Alpha/beta hydrolase n=1 Tax=Haloarcula nitratireducens TaxID=2487749 RepID=A0AAW4PEU0_9EURY|nr:alpha/beta hydrolase [Halomicroarcula nitratireducens]MBX0295782.1 alpha/beta hydrolase [Halomicroarcula nitratireducens]
MASESAVTVEGTEIHYREIGDGHPVVLLHGGIIDAAHVSWPPVENRLAPEYHVVAPDLLGYGESELADRLYSIPGHAEVIAGFLDQLDLGPVTLVGLSLGGGVAIQLALDRPDLVETLVPIDPFGLGRELPNGLLSYGLARVQMCNKLAIAAFRRSRRLTRASLDGIVYDLDSLSESAVDAVYREVQRPTAGAAFRRFREAEVTREGYRTTFTGRFDDLSVPTRLLHGAHDELFPVAWAERAADRIPDAELRVLDDCAHWAPREDPDVVAAHVEDAVDGF